MSLFDFLKQIQAAGSAMISRGALNFLAPFSLADDPTNNRINVSLPSAGGGSSGLMSAADKAFLDSEHVALGTNLADANATITLSQGAIRQVPNGTFTATRTITLGTSDSPPAGSLISVYLQSQLQYQASFSNGGVGGGTLATSTQGTTCLMVFRFDGTNWGSYWVSASQDNANANYPGLLDNVSYSKLQNLITTPVVSFTSGTPTLTPATNAPETLFYLSGTVSAPKLPVAGSNIGKRVIVKCENLSGCAVTADTGAPDLIDGAATYTVPGSYGSASFHMKASGVVRAFPGLT